MQARMTNPGLVVPDAMEALQALCAAIGKGGVPSKTINLVHAGQPDQRMQHLPGRACPQRRRRERDGYRLVALEGWRDVPFYSDAEGAALALTESVTRPSDCSAAVPDAIWDEAAQHYDEGELETLVLAIANINDWNRLNVATRQVAGGSW